MRPVIRSHTGPRQAAACLAALLAIALAAPGVRANDRPFQHARTAMAESDDEGTWSFESWVQRFGSVRGISIEPEYTFTPSTSVQMEFTRLLDRRDMETGHEAEVEFKHLFNDIARAGWGLGASVALGAERTHAEGTVRTVTFKLPLSLALGETGARLHLNAGLAKTEHLRRDTTLAGAIEMDLRPRLRGFAEWARTGRERVAQIGVRHWLTHEHLALDVALQQHRDAEGRRASGFIIGLGWYDL